MKKIALIVDIEGWAFHLAANLIKEALKTRFDVDIFYSKSEPFNENLIKILEQVKNYDIIHFFWRKTLLPICDSNIQEELARKNIKVEDLKQKLSTGVYDHLFIGDSSYNELFNTFCKKYVVSSQKLYDIYQNNSTIKNPDRILGDTFDERIFFPKYSERSLRQSADQLVIGWVGNSEWNNQLKDENGKPIDFKGYHTVLLPVIKELQSEGYHIQLYCADKKTNYIPSNEMCHYYRNIDIYTCVSISEGTPKPLLEAMGSGVATITTDVGVAKEYLGNKQQEFILPAREIGKSEDKIKEELKNKIIKLYNDRKLLLELSQENYEQSKYFNYQAYQQKYLDYFSNF
ncbi:MAG: glycosyltransferase [Clostridia bacterium]|nr:glycosyltransferase [Clostridia bacterium]